jgi:hypothetical protein
LGKSHKCPAQKLGLVQAVGNYLQQEQVMTGVQKVPWTPRRRVDPGGETGVLKSQDKLSKTE